jgi:hypothetical protein
MFSRPLEQMPLRDDEQRRDEQRTRPSSASAPNDQEWAGTSALNRHAVKQGSANCLPRP